MGLNVVDDTEKVSLGPSKDGTYTGAKGGTELMNDALNQRVDKSLLEQFNIIKSRVRWVDPKKKNILWLHDTWDDPEAKHLKEKESVERFAKLVFVSNWQLTTYNMGLGVPYHYSTVLKNAIEPITVNKSDKGSESDPIRIIYHTTPHRGLNLLYAAVDEITKQLGNRVHLDVYSSFEAYGWKERDEPYKDLFKAIENHPQMTYYGYRPNEEVREALKKAHIFGYPSCWPETSCISAIEAMSAGCDIVCSNFAALPETTGNWATMYQFSEDPNTHANRFANHLYQAIQTHWLEDNQKKLAFAKNWADNYYNWDIRAAEWTDLLQGLAKNA